MTERITTMTSRERLQRTFRRQAVDRVPVAPFLYYNNVYEMFGYSPSIDQFFDPPDFFLDGVPYGNIDAFAEAGKEFGHYS